MFTGIIEATGEIDQLQAAGGDWCLKVSSHKLDFSDVKIGDSISVSGVCLTATALSKNSFSADVSNETMACTALGQLTIGDMVNLEKAMLPTTRLGGHIVSGHVDGLAELMSKTSDGRSVRLVYRVPVELAKYIAHKGSVCLDGVSLTVNDVKEDSFDVNIIPHTTEETTIHLYKPGRKVNLEVDVISRYLERLLQGTHKAETPSLSQEFLANHGFAPASN